jgi:hypothetical protein
VSGDYSYEVASRFARASYFLWEPISTVGDDSRWWVIFKLFRFDGQRTIQEVARSVTKDELFCALSCDFVDRTIPPN